MSNPWFTVDVHSHFKEPENKNCQKTCSPSLMSFSPVIMPVNHESRPDDVVVKDPGI